MIVTIDGPAASGKSSTARAVAARLGFRHLESGALYRGLTFAALEEGVPPAQWETLDPERLEALNVRAVPGAGGFRIFAREHDVTESLRGDAVNRSVARMAKIPAVRSWLLGRLRSAAQGTDLVADGRDMGTVVFPGADVKVFLTASLEARAMRRAREVSDGPDPARIATEMQELAERDRVDMEREIAPLRPADDATHVDTTRLSFDEQVGLIVGIVERKRSG
jgi:cytidylate kinase